MGKTSHNDSQRVILRYTVSLPKTMKQNGTDRNSSLPVGSRSVGSKPKGVLFLRDHNLYFKIKT